MAKFNLIEALEANGFQRNPFGEEDMGLVLVKDYSKEVEVAWFGMQKSTISVEVYFNPEMTVCKAFYYQQGSRRAFKEKTHLADKRAFNAIKNTVEYKGFEF